MDLQMEKAEAIMGVCVPMRLNPDRSGHPHVHFHYVAQKFDCLSQTLSFWLQAFIFGDVFVLLRCSDISADDAGGTICDAGNRSGIGCE